MREDAIRKINLSRNPQIADPLDTLTVHDRIITFVVDLLTTKPDLCLIAGVALWSEGVRLLKGDGQPVTAIGSKHGGSSGVDQAIAVGIL